MDKQIIDGLAQDYSISIANALETLQPCIKPSLYGSPGTDVPCGKFSYTMIVT